HAHGSWSTSENARLTSDGTWSMGASGDGRLTDTISARASTDWRSDGSHDHTAGISGSNWDISGAGTSDGRLSAEGELSGEDEHGEWRTSGSVDNAGNGRASVGFRGNNDLGINGSINHNSGSTNGGVEVSGRADEHSNWRAHAGLNTDGRLEGGFGFDHRLSTDDALNFSLSGSDDGFGSANIGFNGVRGDSRFDTNIGLSNDSSGMAANAGGNLNISNLFGDDANFDAGGNGSMRFRRRTEVVNDGSVGGALRDRVLTGSDDNTRFVSFGASGTSTVNTGFELPMGPVSTSTGFRRGDRLDVEVIRLEDGSRLGEAPNLDDLRVNTRAAGILGLRAGEAIRVTGESSNALNLGVSFNHGMGVGPAGATIRAGAEATYVVTGKTTTEVTRGFDSAARVVMSAASQTNRGSGMKINVNLNLVNALQSNVGEGTLLAPVANVATGIATNLLNQWMGAGVSASRNHGEGDERLVDVTLDLSRPEVREAYDRAIQGDWTELDTLVDQKHPGVAVDKSIFTELRETALPLTHFALGISSEGDSRESVRRSEVRTAAGTFDVESDLDTNRFRDNNWFFGRDTDVADFNRVVRGRAGADLGATKPVENWLVWSHKKERAVASTDDVRHDLGLARYLLQGDGATQLAGYEAMLDTIPEHRKFFVGPRNEMRRAKVKTDILVSDAGLDRIATHNVEAMWTRFQTAWQSVHPNEQMPTWVHPAGRRSLELNGPLAHTTAEFYQYHRTSEMIRTISEAATLSENERNDAIRGVLAKSKHDPALMALMGDLAGREHLEIRVGVDSTAGKSERQYDFKLQYTGDQFEIQAKVFGRNL
ncbi:MAG: hypothetical protein VX834_09030, partial [Myxococcota bacterium]|nr:hypothetical protein [Myxococcota bacterium]